MLDCLPLNRPVFVTEGATAKVLLLPRDGLDAPIVQSGLSTSSPSYAWDRRVYDEGSVSPETPIHTLLAQARNATNSIDSAAIFSTVVQQTAEAPQPAGYTLRDLFDPVALFSAVGGKTYTIEYTLRLTTTEVIVHRVPLVVKPAYN